LPRISDDAGLVARGSTTGILLIGLPDITEAVSLDGYTQSGSAKDSLATGFNAVLRIRLSGAAAGAGASGLAATRPTVLAVLGASRTS
jgi:hypothetical protein